MNNPRITKKERGLLKGALRRVFVRSDIRNKVADRASIVHFDPNRKRVRKWSRCELCKKPTPKYLIQVDHIEPVIPVNSSFEEMTLDDTVNRLWCEESNLQAICPECHDVKTKQEKEARKINRREREGNRNEPSKRSKKTTKKCCKRNAGRSTNARACFFSRKKIK